MVDIEALSELKLVNLMTKQETDDDKATPETGWVAFEGSIQRFTEVCLTRKRFHSKSILKAGDILSFWKMHSRNVGFRFLLLADVIC